MLSTNQRIVIGSVPNAGRAYYNSLIGREYLFWLRLLGNNSGNIYKRAVQGWGVLGWWQEGRITTSPSIEISGVAPLPRSFPLVTEVPAFINVSF